MSLISGNVPKHLVVDARTGFLTATGDIATALPPFAEQYSLDSKSTTMVDLGSAPMPTENKGRATVQSFIEKYLQVEPRDWDITVGLSHNAMMDDQTNSLESKVRSAGENFRRDMSNKCFEALDSGDSTTAYGACYDGLSFFNNSHIDEGADYQTAQDNLYSLDLTLNNFKTVRAAGRSFLDDRGEPVDLMHNLIVCHPDQEFEVSQITGNPQDATVADRAINPYSGQVSYITSAKLTSGSWSLVDTSRQAKPVYMAVREQPNLQAAWFDPNAGEGGMYYFKFYARYNVFYGDWRLALMGKS